MTSAYGTEAIWDIFDESIVTFTGPDGSSVRYGSDANPYPEPLFGITAWNPGEERPHEENVAANERLKAHLTQSAIRFVDAEGASPDGTWNEPGYVLIGTDRATAVAVAREFGQLAIHEMANGVLRVVKSAGNSDTTT
ncbi:MAG: DUF3293 domain-containing protein [Microthrixaceae bacterium]|mgnify:CR=1 FL=1|nr:DUF3293 domain-containing protein [Microthrixaceae bacterium]MCO5311429.1 DUF3293 domain-containing protein [Microthrixaceae bacterium]HPB46060.1 DUF3293 domain-containing protein [Microthrixaceae bacterium]